MSGFRLPHMGERTVLTPTFWVDPEEMPVFFVVVKDGATALATPDYIADTLAEVDDGGLHLEEAWDHLMIKAPNLPYPQPCEIRYDGRGGFGFTVNGQTVLARTAPSLES